MECFCFNRALNKLLQGPPLWLVLWACLLAFGAGAATQVPVLRMDDPFVSTLRRVGLESSGQTLVAGLSSGSLAVWRTDALGKPRLLHLPVRNEEARRAHPIAISANGRLIAYGAPPLRDGQGRAITGTALIYIVDADSLRILRQLEAVGSRAQDLKFSADGRYLAAALSSGCGVRVWRTDNWEPFAADEAGYGPAPCGSPANLEIDALSVAFTPGGRVWLVTSGVTGVRTYAEQAGRLLPLRYLPPDKLGLQVPDGIAISPHGEWVAIGDRRERTPGGRPLNGVLVLRLDSLDPAPFQLRLRAADLRFPDRIDPQKFDDAHQFNLSRVAWARLRDEEWLVAAGAFPCVAAQQELVVRTQAQPPGLAEMCAVAWPLSDKAAAPRFFPVGTEQVNDLALSAANELLVTASDRAITTYTPQREGAGPARRWTQASSLAMAADLRNQGWEPSDLLRFSVSSDAGAVQLQTYPGPDGSSATIGFDVSRLAMASLDGVELHAARVDDPAIAPWPSWVNSPRSPLSVGAAGNAPGRPAWDLYRAAMVLPGRRLVVGSANFLRVYAAEGSQVTQRCELRIAAEAFRLNASSDGSTLVVAHGDGTVRWYGLRFDPQGQCRLLRRLAVHFRQDPVQRDWRWVAWVPPTGEFASDPQARGLLSWQLDNPDCRSSVVGFEALTRALYDQSAVASAWRRDSDEVGLPGLLDRYCSALKTAVVAPAARAKVRTQEIAFTLAVSGLGGQSGQMVVTLGGSQRLAASVNGRAYSSDEPVRVDGDGRYTLNVQLPARPPSAGSDFQVCFQVQQERDCHVLVWDGANPPPKPRRLWAVLVGISDYGMRGVADASSLRFAQNDVMDLAGLFLADHQRQAAADAPGRPRDYTDLSLHLFVAPLTTPESTRELQALGQQPGVQLGQPSATAIYAALDSMAERIRREGAPEDLFIFYFSGHGLAAPVQQTRGATVLVLPAAPQQRFQPGGDDYLDSAELLTRLARIQARKVVLLDACRNAPFDARAPIFDAAKMSQEFEASVPSASIIFSTTEGYGSLETSQYFFSPARGTDHRGNGLFSYMLLTGLAAARTPEESVGFNPPDKISARHLGEFIERSFNTRRAADPATFRQMPQWIPGHIADPVFMRTVDVLPRRAPTTPQP